MYKNKILLKKEAKRKIRLRIRKKISGTLERPRVLVNKSNKYIYLQVIDDKEGRVLSSASTLEKEFKTKNKNWKNKDTSKALGELMAQRLKKKKISTIIFDRGIYPYHGRIKLLAEAMRKGGLNF